MPPNIQCFPRQQRMGLYPADQLIIGSQQTCFDAPLIKQGVQEGQLGIAER